ncbi:MAG: tetratricopeptide repeat protein, partial [Pyrinomonadaceae bacterium]|nr:tetratricopeptide repeat protein [Pyrinomonadaceae bacterium]
MFQIINEVKEVIENFIADEDKSVMIIQDTLEESPLLLKVFGIIEESEESNDIFLSFGDEFQDTRRFVEAIIENQKLQIEALNIELEKIGREKIAEIPKNLLERDKPSNARLELLFKHIRKNVEPERRVIWVFHPLQDVEKDTFYADLFEYISQRIFTDEINFTKIIVRDTPTKILQNRLGKHKQVSVYQPKISHKDIFKKIEESAKSKDTPNEEKAQSIMLLAGIDIAERRYEKALSRNRQVLNYYEKTKQKPQQSIVQNNIGDVFYVQGKYAEAQAEYEKAILIAVEEKSQPLVLYQSVNLGNSLFM